MTDRTQKLQADPTNQRLWAEWYRTIYPKLYYAALRLSQGNAELAQDLTQEALTRFLDYRAIERVKDDRHAGAFLITTCRNLAIDRNARAREIPQSELGELELEADDATPQVDLERILATLEPKERELMQWVREGLTLAEIAQRTGSTYTAIGVRVHRIRQALKKSFGSG